MLPNKKYTPADVTDILRRRVALLVVPPLIGLFVALVYSSRLPNVYQAEMLVQIVPQRVPTTFVPTTVTIKTEDRLEALTQQVTSRTQLERIITDLNLYPEVRSVRPMQDVVEMMRPNIALDPVRQNRAAPVEAFYLRFKYSDAAIAARVTERLGTLYVDQNARERGALASAARDFLENQVAESRVRLQQQEAKVRSFRERNAGRLPSQLDSNMQAIQSTQLLRQSVVESLSRDRDSKLMLERLYNEALAMPAPVTASAAAGGTDSAAAANLTPQQRLEMERGNLQRLEQRLTADHPDVRRSRRQVAELEKLVESSPAQRPTAPGLTAEEAQRQERIAERRAAIESLERQITFKESEERRLNGVIAEYQRRIESVPGVESEYVALTRDLETMNQEFKDLLSKSQSARSAVELENRQVSEQFRVLDAPRAPLRPISPTRALISGVGLGTGLALGALLVVLLEVRDGSLKTTQDIESVLMLPVVALVPRIDTAADRSKVRQRWVLAAAASMCLVCVAGYVFWSMRLWTFVA